MKRFIDMTAQPVLSTLIKQGVPMLLGMVGMVVFNLTDTFFIARLGTTPLAAMSLTLPVVMVFGAISMGLGVGTSAIVSQRIGAHDSNGVRRLVTDSLAFSFVLVILSACIGFATVEPLFRMLGADEVLLPYIREYMFIWYAGLPFVIIPMVGNNAIRAAGNTLIPSLIMLAAILINVVLDPLLIFGIGPFPRLELKGAAIATVIARAVTLIVSLLFIHFHFRMLAFNFAGIKQTLKSWYDLLVISVPATITQLIAPLSMAVVAKLIMEYGEHAIAALGVGHRIESFALAPIMALGAVLTPFAGQNFGAKKLLRIKSGLKFVSAISLVWGVLLCLLFLLFRRYIAILFSENELTIQSTLLYLAWVPLGYGAQGLTVAVTALFSAIGRPLGASLLHAVRLGILVVFCLIGSRYWGLSGIFGAIAVTSVLTGAAGYVWFSKSLRDLDQSG